MSWDEGSGNAAPGPNDDPCPECNSRWCDGPGQDVDPDTGLPDELCWRARRDMRKRESNQYAEEMRIVAEAMDEIFRDIGDPL